MRAAKIFITDLKKHKIFDKVDRVRIDLYGSLALTGKGHGTPAAILMGMEGEIPDSIDTTKEELPQHPNGMRFLAFDREGEPLINGEFFSIGGGFVVNEITIQKHGDNVFYKAYDKSSVDLQRSKQDEAVTFAALPFRNASELLQVCNRESMTIAQVVYRNELHWRSESEIRRKLMDIWNTMDQSIKNGCLNDEEYLPGSLKIRRRAPGLYRNLLKGSMQTNAFVSHNITKPPIAGDSKEIIEFLSHNTRKKLNLLALDFLSLYAIAVNEENAAGGRVVTAPTNGAAGIIPAVLKYYLDFISENPEKDIMTFLFTSAAIGMIYKRGASISAAEMGCQGEVGVACSMSAAGLAAVMGATPKQVENAAEIGMEHNLGLTCDPINGLVQVPCIERNALGAVKAVAAAQLALNGDGYHRVTLDQVIETMRQTGIDMKSKYKETSQGGLAVNVPLYFTIAKTRNIGIIAHIDAGKTTTTERMLYYAGFTRRIGDVDDGDTVMDYMKQERERGITITSAAITFGWKNYRINLIDTPGHADFTIEVERSVRVLDGAVTILDAVSGVEAQTQTVWKQADRYGIPRIAYVNKMDRVGAGFGRTVKEMRYKLGARPLVCQIPVVKKDKGNSSFTGVADLLNMQVLNWDDDPNGSVISKTPLTEKYPVSGLFEEAIKGRSSLVEALSEMDDHILELFLEAEDHMKVTAGDIRQALRRVTINGKAVPVLCGASFRNIGVQSLMDAVVEYLPSPLDCPPTLATLPNNQLVKITLGGNERLCALAFKVTHDSKRGPMTFVRVYSGKLDNRMALYNTNTRKKERVNKLLQMYANDVEEIPSITAGNIGVIIGLKETRTGDTLIQFDDTRKNLKLQNIEIPAPVFYCAVEAAGLSDEKPLEEALNNILREDPSLHVHVDPDSGQTLISGMGELHLEIVKDRLVNEFKVNAELGKMRVSYRETATTEHIDYTYLYDREIMGKRAKAKVSLTITPLPQNDRGLPEEGGNRIMFENFRKIESVPGTDQGVNNQRQNNMDTKLSNEEIESVLRTGIISGLYRGPILGFQITGLLIKICSIELYGVESSRMAISSCARQALIYAVKEGKPVLLEPLMNVNIDLSEEYLGIVLGDLSGTRRGNILGLDTIKGMSEQIDQNVEIYVPPDSTYTSSSQTSTFKSKKVIHAQVPLSTMLGYSSALRSLTGGTASFDMRVHSFGIMSEDRAKAVIREMQGSY
ncbi:952_t:CDS:2 [Acaulospora morrowiae]|uniref:Ribosome-releasing factor 2, mitochondrial n=1 Tax=Acaulospora morrowiae TaxID=94023 RepID=A0A9N8VM07_9GLOM|nr:952_t:CDS:2 [Acaulospora morrowiae]